MDEPTHVLREAGDKRSLCGVKTGPRVLLRHVEAHVRGHGMSVCSDCLPEEAEEGCYGRGTCSCQRCWAAMERKAERKARDSGAT